LKKIFGLVVFIVIFVWSTIDGSMINKNLETVLLFAIDQTNKIARQYSQREFDLLGININVEQWVLLKTIEEKNLLSQNELAKITNRDPASITRTLDILQKKELIIRESIPENRRQYNIKLTKNGSSFIIRHMHVVNEIRNKSIKGFTKEEVKQLIAMLEKVQNNMK
jgi:MarR family transcriptional regulator, transcriptional regulator for hemolysin